MDLYTASSTPIPDMESQLKARATYTEFVSDRLLAPTAMLAVTALPQEAYTASSTPTPGQKQKEGGVKEQLEPNRKKGDVNLAYNSQLQSSNATDIRARSAQLEATTQIMKTDDGGLVILHSDSDVGMISLSN